MSKIINNIEIGSIILMSDFDKETIFKEIKKKTIKPVYREMGENEWRCSLQNLNHLPTDKIEVAFKKIK